MSLIKILSSVISLLVVTVIVWGAIMWYKCGSLSNIDKTVFYCKKSPPTSSINSSEKSRANYRKTWPKTVHLTYSSKKKIPQNWRPEE